MATVTLTPIVTSLSKAGSTPLQSDITLSEGSNVTLTQAGQDIQIAASSSGGGIGGSGTTNTISKFTSSSDIGDSNITDDGTVITIGNGKNLLAGQTTGKIGFGGAVSGSDYLLNITLDSTQDWKRGINITQANDSAEDSDVINISNTATLVGDRTITNLNLSLTPTMTITGSRSIVGYSIWSTSSAANITFGSGGNDATFYGLAGTTTASPTFNSSSSADAFIGVGVSGIAQGSPTLTSVTSGSSYETYGGIFTNNVSSAGSASLVATAYGISASSTGDLTTTGTTVHYGGKFFVSGTADNNYGINIIGVSAATNNYGLAINSISSGSTNYAIYSTAAAQSYFAGSIGIGVTSPTALLQLAAGTASAGTAPLKFTSGTNLTTAEAGSMEFNGTDLFFTRTGTTRENVLVAVDNATAPSTSATPVFTSYYGGDTKALGDPNRWISVNILGSDYKIPLYT